MKTFIVILIIFYLSSLFSEHIVVSYTNAFSESPSFVRQEIIDDAGDWRLWKIPTTNSTIPMHNGHSINVDNADNISECKIAGKYPSPDIESVSYISDGKKLSATVWLTKPFIPPTVNDTIDAYSESLQIKATSLSSDQKNLENLANKKIVHLLSPTNPFLNMTINEKSNTTAIDGVRAYKIVYNFTTQEGQDLKNMTFLTIRSGKLYDITYSATQANYSDYLQPINEIVNSLRFENAAANSKPIENQIIKNGAKYEFKGLGISIKYPNNWKAQEIIGGDKKYDSITLNSPFRDKMSEAASWHEVVFTMAIAIDSVQHQGVTDYRVIYSRSQDNDNHWNWTRKVLEVSAFDKTRQEEQHKNYTYFFQRGQPYVLFSFDLDKVNFPQQYRAVFYITDYYVKNHKFCRLIDTTSWAIMPPPDFTISTTPTSITLRPGEQKDIKLTIKSNTHLQSKAFLRANPDLNINRNNVSLTFNPTEMSIPAASIASSTLHVNASDNSKPLSDSFPITARISFPNTIINRGGEAFSNQKSVSLDQTSNMTLTVLPNYSPQEYLSNVVSTWISPITGIWTFLAGVGAVIAPLIIRLYQKKQKETGAAVGQNDKRNGK